MFGENRRQFHGESFSAAKLRDFDMKPPLRSAFFQRTCIFSLVVMWWNVASTFWFVPAKKIKVSCGYCLISAWALYMFCKYIYRYVICYYRYICISYIYIYSTWRILKGVKFVAPLAPPKQTFLGLKFDARLEGLGIWYIHIYIYT